MTTPTINAFTRKIDAGTKYYHNSPAVWLNGLQPPFVYLRPDGFRNSSCYGEHRYNFTANERLELLNVGWFSELRDNHRDEKCWLLWRGKDTQPGAASRCGNVSLLATTFSGYDGLHADSEVVLFAASYGKVSWGCSTAQQSSASSSSPTESDSTAQQSSASSSSPPEL